MVISHSSERRMKIGKAEFQPSFWKILHYFIPSISLDQAFNQKVAYNLVPDKDQTENWICVYLFVYCLKWSETIQPSTYLHRLTKFCSTEIWILNFLVKSVICQGHLDISTLNGYLVVLFAWDGNNR